MMRQLALAEFEGDVSLLAKESSGIDRWIAVTPLAMDELEMASYPYGIETDYCTPEALDRIGLQNFEKAERLCEAYDSFLRKRCPILADWGLYPLRDHFTRVKFLLDAVTTRLHIMTKILDREQPGVVVKVKAPGRGESPPSGLWYTVSESLYGDILDIFLRQRGVSVRWVERPGGHRNRVVKMAWGQHVRRLRKALRLVSRLRLKSARSRAGEPCILLLSDGYDIDPLVEALRCRPLQFLHLDVPKLLLRRYHGLPLRLQLAGDAREKFNREFLGVTAELQRLRLGASICQANGYDFFPLVQSRLLHYVRTNFPHVAYIRDYLKALTARYRIDAVISPFALSIFDFKAVFAFFQQGSVPTLVVQHGAFGYNHNPVSNYSEFNFSGCFLAWGPGIERHYGPTKKGPVQFVPTGSILLDQIVARRQSVRPDPTKLMYVITDFRGYSAYFPGGQPDLDTAYYRLQQDVIRLLAQFADRYSVILKVPPRFNATGVYKSPLLQWLGKGRYRITVERRPLLDVLHDIGLVIIDHPSTTLIQCSATGAAIIVYSGAPHHSVMTGAEALLAKRAICCRTKEAFLQAIERALVEGIRPGEEDINDEFLAEYGTFLNDGKSSERMTEMLSAVLSRGATGSGEKRLTGSTQIRR